MRPALPVFLSLAALAACAAPEMTEERAARLCAEEARQADGISGRVGVGVGSGGGRAGGSITITNDILNPRSEQQALEECIARRMAGEPSPTRFGLTIGAGT
ncbi:hypothetical protein HKCCE3408_01125 [Rhodobacterales bacterium HKCCE3408]|nr:hypothetical protein [Rhodobacterales bacterium HKCCE3408]